MMYVIQTSLNKLARINWISFIPLKNELKYVYQWMCKTNELTASFIFIMYFTNKNILFYVIINH